jgi:large subunit ribosomal protein L9
MKVVFLQDVARVAKAGEIKEVADGYGRNYLIPQNIALLASTSTLNDRETQLKIKAQREANEEAEMVKIAEELQGREITLKAKAGAKEHLYGSITNADIADELQKIAGLVIDKRKIELIEPIRQLGSYDVIIKLARNIIPKIKVNVIGEGTG